MKKLLFTVLLIVGFTSVQAQTPISYSEVVQVEGVPKEDLYQRAREWFTDTFRSSNDVIQLDDKENGQIVGKGLFKYVQRYGIFVWDCTIRFTVSVAVKDGRYRYEINDFEHSADNANNRLGLGLNIGVVTNQMPAPPLNNKAAKNHTEKVYNYAVEQIDEQTEGFIVSLKKAMDSPTVVQSEDW